MNAKRRRRSHSSQSVDYRNVSVIVHERRAERERDPAIFRQNPEDAERKVRTYTPEERLRAIDQETNQLVDDARDIPRTWDPDAIPQEHEVPVEFVVLFVLQVSSLIFLSLLARIGGIDIVPSVVIVIGALVACSIVFHRKLGAFTWLGLFVAAIEIFMLATFGGVIVS
jgi:hypothetical protein